MSCFGGRDERIYLVEVLVHKLTLTPGKIKDIGDHPVTIKIEFLDFPAFEITREDFDAMKPSPPDEDGTLHFMIGRSCLFVRKPKDLVRELQSSRVKVGVFRVGDTYPTAETEITMSGCLCDQIAMSANDPDNLPKPFVVKDGFHLVDPGENPSGMLDMELRLTCFGRSITTLYDLRPNFFVFRNQGKEREFRVERVIPSEYLRETEEEPMKHGDDVAPEKKDTKKSSKKRAKKGKKKAKK